MLSVLLPALLCGCTAPEADSARPPRAAPLNDVRAATRDMRPGGIGEAIRLGHLPGAGWEPQGAVTAPRGPEDMPDLSVLGPPISAELDDDLGEKLLDFVADNIEDRLWLNYGVSALTYEQIWGEEEGSGLCEEPAALVQFEEDGTDWEASYSLGMYGSFIGEPELQYETMPSSCSNEIVESGGDLSSLGGGCDEFYEHTFYEEGSDCRACLESQAGDWDGCVEEGACLTRAPLMSWVDDGDGPVWRRTGIGRLLACAPNLTTNIYILADYGDDGSLPRPWDHAAWTHMCVSYWDESARAPAYGCSPGVGGWEAGHTLGGGAVGRVNHIREAGSDGTPHLDRIWYASGVDLGRDGDISWFWATTPGAGQISAPETGFSTGSSAPDLSAEPFSHQPVATWGMNPLALRPDGTDPSDIDDTFARDWLATLTLKTATTRDGVLINTANASRCEDGSWEGPFPDGSWRCTDLMPPRAGWHNDAATGAWSGLSTDGGWSTQDFPQVFHLPLTTIGSTSLAPKSNCRTRASS